MGMEKGLGKKDVKSHRQPNLGTWTQKCRRDFKLLRLCLKHGAGSEIFVPSLKKTWVQALGEEDMKLCQEILRLLEARAKSADSEAGVFRQLQERTEGTDSDSSEWAPSPTGSSSEAAPSPTARQGDSSEANPSPATRAERAPEH